MSQYNQDSIKTLSFGKSVRTKIGMYLTADLDYALILGLRELIYNAMDEYQQGFGNRIVINIDTKTNIISCSDNARGIPVGDRADGVNSLVAAFTMPHSGAKHDTEVYASAVGINGIGAKVVCHTSEWLEVDIYRDGKKHSMRFTETDEGAIPGELKVVNSKGYSGTVVKYLPSKIIYGERKINVEEIRATLKELSYFTKGMEFILSVDGKAESFIAKNGLADALNNKERVHKHILYYMGESNDCKVELALQWCKKDSELKSFANNLYVPDGGAFMTGFKTSLTKAFNAATKREFSGDIIRKYLDGYVSVKVKVPQFSNQAKTSLANPEARTAVASAITEAFKDFAANNTTDMDKILELMEREQKAELAAQRAREAERTIIQGQKKATLIDNLPSKLAEATGSGYREIFIVEGDSAGGTLKMVRDHATQAVMPLRGKVLNTFDKDLADIILNKEIKDMLMTFGCGAGTQVNLKNLRYDKIIIATDRDSDGGHISVLLLAFFLQHLRPIVEKGLVYRAITPLYSIGEGKKKHLFYTDEELNDYINKNGKPKHISRYKGLGAHSEDEIEEYLVSHDSRILVQLTTEDLDKTVALFTAMMGKNLELRKLLIREGGEADE